MLEKFIQETRKVLMMKSKLLPIDPMDNWMFPTDNLPGDGLSGRYPKLSGGYLLSIGLGDGLSTLYLFLKNIRRYYLPDISRYHKKPGIPI